MGPKVTNAIMGLSNRMLTFKATQEAQGEDAEVSQREFLILELLKEKGTMNVSDISEAVPNVSYSTISTDLTRLWRDKKFVSKNIEPDNQRVTLVTLTEKGKKAVEQMQSKRTELMNQLYKALNTTKEEEQVLIRVSERATKYFDKLLGINGHKK
ncbi:MAG: winged helix-turn-helix transcriptional regulator [Phycisphaerae bacterium]